MERFVVHANTMPELASSKIAQYVFDHGDRSIGKVFYIYGASLSGRSYVCQQLENRAAKISTYSPQTYRHICKPSDAGHEIFTAVLKRIGQQKKFSKADGKTILKNGWPGLLKAGRSLASLIFPWIPSELDKLIDAFASAVKNMTGGKHSEFPQSSVDKLLELLKSSVQHVDGDGILIIVDTLEEMPAPGLLLVDAILQSPIEGVTLALVVNEESGAIKLREHQRIRARLQQKSIDTVIKIVGHSVAEIIDWKEAKSGVVLTLPEATHAFQKSENGRSGLLAKWVAVPDRGSALIEQECARLFGHLDIEFSAFSAKLQSVVSLLAKTYPDPVPLSEIAKAYDIKLEDMVGVRDSVIGSFAEDAGEGLKLKRAAVFEYVLQRVGPALISAQAIPLPASNAALPTIPGGQVIGFSTDQRLSSIQNDLRRGAIQSASNRIDVALKLIDESATEQRARLFRHSAEVYEQRGEYKNALLELEKAARLTTALDQRCEIVLETAENYFRLGDSSKAMRSFSWVRRNAKESELDIWFKAILRLISVAVERDKIYSAIRFSRIALKGLSLAKPSDRMASHVFRAAARALVLNDSLRDEALHLAKKAANIAEHLGLGHRPLGNCLYAIGDVHRHRQEYQLASENYKKSLALADANFDLAIYCHLGLAAMALNNADERGLRLEIEELNLFPIDPESPEYKVVENYKIALCALENSAIHVDGVIAWCSEKKSNERKWQTELDRVINGFSLSSDQATLLAGLKELIIIL